MGAMVSYHILASYIVIENLLHGGFYLVILTVMPKLNSHYLTLFRTKPLITKSVQPQHYFDCSEKQCEANRMLNA
jgi:hypothetical protein